MNDALSHEITNTLRLRNGGAVVVTRSDCDQGIKMRNTKKDQGCIQHAAKFARNARAIGLDATALQLAHAATLEGGEEELDCLEATIRSWAATREPHLHLATMDAVLSFIRRRREAIRDAGPISRDEAEEAVANGPQAARSYSF